MFETSLPIYDPESIRYVVTAFTHTNLRRLLSELNVCYPYQIKLDVQSFYPTMYTHAITWALLGKNRAKKLYRSKSHANENGYCRSLYNIANELDKAVQSGQFDESYGIPIGPDHSLVIAEILAKRLTLDLYKSLSERLANNFFIVRHVDDFFVFTKSEFDQKFVLNTFRVILKKYNLILNENKVKYSDAREPTKEAWLDEVSSFAQSAKSINGHFKSKEVVSYLRKIKKGCYKFNGESCHFIFKKIGTWELEAYFSMLRRLQKDYPESNVITYGLRRLHFSARIRPPFFGSPFLMNDAKHFYRTLDVQLARLLVAYPQAVDVIADVYLWYEFMWHHHPVFLSSAIEVLLKNKLDLTNEHFEVLWLLWLAKHFSIELEEPTLSRLIKDIKNELVILAVFDYLYFLSSTKKDLSEGLARSLISRINNFETEISLPKKVKEPLDKQNWYFLYAIARTPWSFLRKEMKISATGAISSEFLRKNVHLFDWQGKMLNEYDNIIGPSRRGRGGVSARAYLT